MKKEFNHFYKKAKQIAKVKVKLFRLQHPDIIPCSAKENRIALLIRSGEDPEIAYKIVKYFYQEKKVRK